jgi:hypothetical protein
MLKFYEVYRRQNSTQARIFFVVEHKVWGVWWKGRV